MPHHSAFRPDSSVASEYRPALAIKHNDVRPRPAPVAIVIHDTGPGPALRVNPKLDRELHFQRWRVMWPTRRTSFGAAAWVYEVASPYCGHYLVGQGGECIQLVPEDLAAMHVGSSRAGGYRLPAFAWAKTEHAWWRERWRGLSSPRALAGGKLWSGGSC